MARVIEGESPLELRHPRNYVPNEDFSRVALPEAVTCITVLHKPWTQITALRTRQRKPGSARAILRLYRYSRQIYYS